MIFETVKSRLTDILGSAEHGRFRTLGYKDNPSDSEYVRNQDRTVAIYYGEGEFDGPPDGPADHTAVFEVELSVSKSAEGDLSVLASESSTQGERAAALANMQDAKYLADQSLDELIGIVFQILLDNRNRDAGFDTGIVRNRWIRGVKKFMPEHLGDLVIYTAKLRYICDIEEEFIGDEGTAGVSPVINANLITQGDEEDPAIAGVNV